MQRKYSYLLLLMVVILASGVGVWLFQTYLEGEKPQVEVRGFDQVIGHQKILEIKASDRKRGLKKVTVSISQGDQSHTLWEKEFPEAGSKELTASISVNPKALSLKDEEAQLSFAVTDFSWRDNRNVINHKVIIDTVPPRISLLTPSNYLNPGGTGVIMFMSSEEPVETGVMINDYNAVGYPLTISGRQVFVAYFPIPLVTKKEPLKILIYAQDKAGNRSLLPLPHLLREKKFSQDNMVLSAGFLHQKMAEFEGAYPELRGKTPLEIFVHINTKMREDNFKTIQDICRNSSPKQHWEGTFLRMKDAAPMALFGEKRTYLYEGKMVGESVHLGIDLASKTNAPVEAANNGLIAYVGYLGIYGNTVIIDHGLGLFSLYSHLSNISVKVGEQVNKGKQIGNSGTSGLAGGDHLHFSLIVGGQFVNPVEWWDPKWIADNVTNKINSAIQ